MITGELKRRIDALWTEFWQGGITNPLTVIEQITFLMYARLLDINETRDENRAKRTGKSFERRFKEDEQNLRWSHYRHLGADEMLPVIRDKVFPHFKTTVASGSAFAEFMKDAQLMIQKPGLLVKAVNMIHELPLTEGDTKGDLYEYLLSKLTTAGHQRAIPDAAPHHPTDGGHVGTTADRNCRRSRLRHRRLPGLRYAISAGDAYFAGRNYRGDRPGNWRNRQNLHGRPT